MMTKLNIASDIGADEPEQPTLEALSADDLERLGSSYAGRLSYLSTRAVTCPPCASQLSGAPGVHRQSPLYRRTARPGTIARF